MFISLLLIWLCFDRLTAFALTSHLLWLTAWILCDNGTQSRRIPVLMGTLLGQTQNRPAESSADNVLLKDIQLLMLQKQQAILLNPNDHASAKQVPILQQVRSLMSCSSFCVESIVVCIAHSRCEKKAERRRTTAKRKKRRTKRKKEQEEMPMSSLAVVVEWVAIRAIFSSDACIRV